MKLLFELLHLMWSARVRRWWRGPPYLPRISLVWIKFRLDTAYGLRQDELGTSTAIAVGGEPDPTPLSHLLSASAHIRQAQGEKDDEVAHGNGPRSDLHISGGSEDAGITDRPPRSSLPTGKSVRHELIPKRFLGDLLNYLKWRRHMRMRRK